jgi:hypothetical protein
VTEGDQVTKERNNAPVGELYREIMVLYSAASQGISCIFSNVFYPKWRTLQGYLLSSGVVPNGEL